MWNLSICVRNLGCSADLGYYSIWTRKTSSTPNKSLVILHTKCKIPFFFSLQTQIHSSKTFGEFQTANTLERIQLQQTSCQWRNGLNLANRVFAGYCSLRFTGDWKGHAKTAVPSLCTKDVCLKKALGVSYSRAEKTSERENLLMMSSGNSGGRQKDMVVNRGTGWW